MTTTRGYRLVDYLTQGYLALVALLILLFHGDRVAGWPYYVLAHAACMAGVHCLIRAEARRPGRVLSLFRYFYPLILYSFMYKESGLLDSMFVRRHLDPAFLALEEWAFGFQPSLSFMQKLPFVWVSEPLYFAYFSYYVMIAGVGFALYLRDREAFVRYVTVISLIFYACYLTYILLPVIGPRVITEDIPDFTQDVSAYAEGYRLAVPEAVRSGPFYRIMTVIYERVEQSGGAAFPSSHVAVALATLFFSWRHLKRLRWVHALFVLLLTVSTVYCRYHYVVDIPAGVVTTLALFPIGDKLYRRVDGVRPPDD